jgi:hypothetical protein
MTGIRSSGFDSANLYKFKVEIGLFPFQCSLIGLLGRNWNKPTTWSGTGWADGLVSFTPNYAQD